MTDENPIKQTFFYASWLHMQASIEALEDMQQLEEFRLTPEDGKKLRRAYRRVIDLLMQQMEKCKDSAK